MKPLLDKAIRPVSEISEEFHRTLTSYDGCTWQQLQTRLDYYSENFSESEILGLKQEITRLKEQEGRGPDTPHVKELSPIDANPQPGEMAVDTIYTLEEAADKLKMSVRNVRQWVNDGKIKAFKLGREWRIHEEDLQAVIDNARNR